ncbi:MAG: carboxylating nicotinate-nucleotide diphosphorylase [Thermodesulfobacteriota bacterium]
MDILSLKADINHFLQEDLGTGDITSQAIFAPDILGKAVFIAKSDFVCAGMDIAAEVFKARIPHFNYSAVEDGRFIKTGEEVFSGKGPVIELLQSERVALNLVQRLCGIATLTNSFVKEIGDLPTRVTDTRKTTPGLRTLEKYAVRVGGGHNHRFNLADGIMIKDNHIAACGSILEAVNRVRNQAPHTLKIEVETENFDQVEQCLAAKVDIIMLDNMPPDEMKTAVRLINNHALVEASGGVTLRNIREIAETGVDIISIGALTHSAPSSDISMKLTTKTP